MFISRFLLKATTYNNFNNHIKKCNQKIFDEQNEDYSIIYNNKYELINNDNFRGAGKCKKISISEE